MRTESLSVSASQTLSDVTVCSSYEAVSVLALKCFEFEKHVFQAPFRETNDFNSVKSAALLCWDRSEAQKTAEASLNLAFASSVSPN